jgi:8-oxo-dGTP pyrophosphatase MutT (NUDIX family)
MIKTIADFTPANVETGVGLALQNDAGHYIFFLAGIRHVHLCPPGELFYAGIGGHREADEDWLTCAHREAKEEIGTDIDILPAPATWYIPFQGPVQQIEVDDDPCPLALYEMFNAPGTPRAGEPYHIIIYRAYLHTMPRNIPPDELQGIIALTKEQVVRGLERKPTLSELLNEGALLLTEGSYLDRQIRLYPLGTAIALAHILSFINLE